ncbi:uncharacterized protein EAE97_009311 [Botrytis byssoidea]|uniref:Glycosyltransferase family 32 protein n=1 Tax=Botrytis byssoidea TaxID=139641 RepID=A0A9P5LMX2_9HELO|nr:uncharacterized protein EAE97_009311 [Botrytis byssoidea]KAF7931102.1 hypothetical protein EAE97_009311 [Botrytis byssoidea]
MISLHYHRMLLFFFLLFLSLILLLHFTYLHSLNFNLSLNPLSITNSNAPSRKQKYITQEGKPINQQTIIQLRAKINQGKYPALKKLLEDDVLGVGGQNGEKSEKASGGEKIIHQLWHNLEGGFARRVERRGNGNVGVQKGGGSYGDGKGKGKIHIAEDKEGWEVFGGDGEIPREWEERREYCRGINEQSGWKYILWTSRKSVAFIKTHYPPFLKTYISYSSNSQRVEAMKYLLLYKYGGIVLDMDPICLRALDPFLMLGLFVIVEPLSLSSSKNKNEDKEGDEKLKGTILSRIMGAPRNHGFVVELIDVLMGHSAPGVEGTRERERDREIGGLILTEKLKKGEKLMMCKRDIFGEVWDAYHRRIEEGVLNVGVSFGANTSTSMDDKRGNSGREEMGLVGSVGWRVSVLRKGEGVGRGFFGELLDFACLASRVVNSPHPPNVKPPSPSKPQSKTSHTSSTHFLLPLLILISLSLLITIIFYSHYRSRTCKQPLLSRASSRYERGRKRERVLRSAGLGGGNGEFLFNGYGGGGYK